MGRPHVGRRWLPELVLLEATSQFVIRKDELLWLRTDVRTLPTVREEGTLGITTLSVPEPRSGNCAQCRPIPLQATDRHQPREYAADSLFCYRKSLASIKANKIKTG